MKQESLPAGLDRIQQLAALTCGLSYHAFSCRVFALAYLHPQDLAQSQPDRAAQQSFQAVVQATLSRLPVLVRRRLAPLGFTMRSLTLTDHLITSTKRLQLQQLETACEQLESRHGRLEVPAQMADKTSSVILKVIQ